MTHYRGKLISGQTMAAVDPPAPPLHPTRLKLLIQGVCGGGFLILLALAWLIGISPHPATAQTGGSLFELSWSSPEADHTQSVAWGDVDNDGDLDLAVGNQGRNRLYCNTDGTLTTCWESDEADQTLSVAWGDVDDDGDLDLAVGNDNQPNRLYRNDDGALTATAVWTSTEVDITRSVAWGDVDNDGDLDLAAGNDNQPNRLYRNDNGALTNSAVWSSLESERTFSLAWGDYDGQGGLDLAVGNANNQSDRVYCSQGISLTSCWPNSPTVQDNTSSVAWGDVDGDGDLDLAIGGGVSNLIYCQTTVGGVLNLTLCWEKSTSETARSIAWGDYDRDGDLDLIIGNGQFPLGQHITLYRNDGLANLNFTPVWTSAVGLNTRSVAWGDVDGDGDLDLAVGNDTGQTNQLYRNNSNALTAGAVWESNEIEPIRNLAWGDVDNDGDLDLAVGNGANQPNRLYRNDAGALTATAVWTSAEAAFSLSVAWGDVDGDGDLDLAVGNGSGQPNNHLYRNDNGLLTSSAVWSSTEAEQTGSLVWGDVDGDGDLDLAVANNNGQPNRLYRNDDGLLTNSAIWSSTEAEWSRSLAWGDVDNDGDLDLAVGNLGQPDRLYRNDQGMLAATAVWTSTELGATSSLAWGDVDGDGDLDLAVGNDSGQPNRLYRNDNGALTDSAVWSSNEADPTFSLAWGDVDGDGDLDLAAANHNQPNRLYRNDNGTLTANAAWSSLEADPTFSLAWGDVDGDGNLDLAVGNSNKKQIYLSQATAHPFHPNQTAAVALDLYSDPSPTFNQPVTALAPANFYAVPGIRAKGVIPISYTISDPDLGSTWRVQGFFSPDGEGRWRPAIAAAGTMTRNLASGVTQVYNWDVGNSGFFGQSDNVVFRLEALPAGQLPAQYPYVSAHTFPFRVRGTQVRVVDEAGQPVQDALVYRMPGGQPLGGVETPFRTSSQGYLAGRGELNLGDQLVALWPVSQTDKYTLYHTSAAPTPAGLDAFTVNQTGVQTLTVSAAYPLLIFDLNVSLEWDASNDPLFLGQLQQNLAKTSEALYDWTNGQVALGRVIVQQDKAGWAEAEAHIFASNQIRPIANRGGIVTQTTALTHPSFTRPITASPGEVRIGPTWNRYGEPQPLGNDWPNVLAHELGHYALFLEDTYLGQDENSGVLIPVASCDGSAMSDPYDDVSSEFRYNDADWENECGKTLAELPDWELITLSYPALQIPPPDNSGPASLPLALTQIDLREAPGQAQPLLDDFDIPLDDSLAEGRAYLRQPGQGLIDLGRPILNSLLARGAREGDEVCVFAAEHFACNSLSNSGPAQMTPRPTWQPEIVLTPVSITEAQILVNDATTGPLTATLYPHGEAPQTEILIVNVPQTVTLSQPAVELLVDLVGDEPDKRMITGYAVGAGPGSQRGHGGPGSQRGHGGPFASGDGSVLIYPPEDLPDDGLMVLQTATFLPELPPGLVPIGRAYQIRPNAAVTSFEGGSLTFQYLGLEVLLADIAGAPQEKEKSLAVYYRDGPLWIQLETTLNLTQNFASAPLPGSGLYALAAGQTIPEISAVSPASGDSGQTHTLTISGANFLSPLMVTLKGQSGLTYPLTVTMVNTQTIIALTPITLPPDLYDLELINAGRLTVTQDDAFALYTARPGACFFDDFASGWGKWTRTGEWDILPTAEESATDSPDGSYYNAETDPTRTTTITSRSFNLAACAEPALSFRHDYRLAIGPDPSQDWGQVEISFDDGLTWQLLADYTGGGSYDLSLTELNEWNQVDWQPVTLNLAEAGAPANSTAARLRFNLVVDAEGSDKGWIIDDVVVETCPNLDCLSPPLEPIYLPIVVKE